MSNSSSLIRYPGCCVAKTLPVTFPSKDIDAVVLSFISDVHSRMPCLCGNSIRFSNKPLIPYAVLRPVNSISSHQPNTRAVPVKPTLQKLLSTGINGCGMSQVSTCSRQLTSSSGSSQLHTTHQPPHTAQVVPLLSGGRQNRVGVAGVSSGEWNSATPLSQRVVPAMPSQSE